MSIRFLLLALVFVFAIIARAADDVPVFPGPDNLVPVHPYPGDWHVRYTDQIHSRFKLDPFYFAQMLVTTSTQRKSSF